MVYKVKTKNGNNSTGINTMNKRISDLKSGALIDSISAIVERISSTLPKSNESTWRLPKQVGAILDYIQELTNAIIRPLERSNTSQKEFTHVGILNTILKQQVNTN